MPARIGVAGRVAVLCAGLVAMSIAAADAKTCSAPNRKTGKACVAICQFGCGAYVDNRTGACSRYCFDKSGRMLDNVKFNSLGQQIITPAPVTPPKPTANPTTTTVKCPPGSTGGGPFGGGCITVRPPVAKSGPPPP